MQALKLAARDAVLELRDGVSRHFEQHVKRLVSQVTTDEDFVRSVVLVLAGHAASKSSVSLTSTPVGDGRSVTCIACGRADAPFESRLPPATRP